MQAPDSTHSAIKREWFPHSDIFSTSRRETMRRLDFLSCWPRNFLDCGHLRWPADRDIAHIKAEPREHCFYPWQLALPSPGSPVFTGPLTGSHLDLRGDSAKEHLWPDLWHLRTKSPTGSELASAEWQDRQTERGRLYTFVLRKKAKYCC